jgi:hypothetical protein
MSGGYRCIFDTDRDTKGWTTYHDYNCVGAWKGFLFGTLVSTGAGGYIGNDASNSEVIRIRMKVDIPNTILVPPVANTGRIRWANAGEVVDDGGLKFQDFTVISDGEWHIYEISLNSNEQWVGLVNRLWIYPLINGVAGAEIFINYIEITTSNIYFDKEDNLGEDTYSGRPGYVKSAAVGST